MKRILVATDFSTRSDRAVRRAVLIAGRVGASLTLLHVVDGDRAKELIDSDWAQATMLLEATAQTLRMEHDVAADPLVLIDDVDSGIIGGAEQVSADLIVLGPHRSRLRDIFTGTTVERVVRRSPFPLLVAVSAPSAAYERTLLALDFDEASRSAAKAALAMGIFDHTDVIVMHAFDTPAKNMLERSLDAPEAVSEYVESEREMATDKLDALVRELNLPQTPQRVAAMTGSPARSISEAAQREAAQLIVLGTNQRKGFERMLIGSVTQDVIHDAGRDVLIVPVDGG